MPIMVGLTLTFLRSSWAKIFVILSLSKYSTQKALMKLLLFPQYKRTNTAMKIGDEFVFVYLYKEEVGK